MKSCSFVGCDLFQHFVRGRAETETCPRVTWTPRSKVASDNSLALRWADIVWEERKIRVVKSWKKKGADGDTKTRSSERDVPMGKVLAHYLREWHKQTPYGKPTDFVFPSFQKRGRVPICASVFCRVHLRPAAKQAGVLIPDGHRWGLHNLRHSLSNWLVNKAKENQTPTPEATALSPQGTSHSAPRELATTMRTRRLAF